jgi:hypothetical protein
MRAIRSFRLGAFCCGLIFVALGAAASSAPSLANDLSAASSPLSWALLATTSFLDSARSFVGGFGNWISSLDQSMLLRALGFTVASASIASNWNALGEVRASIVSCERLISFRGLGIGTSDEFIAPMRTLLFTFALYVFYQLVSQVQSLFGGAGSTLWMVDTIMQLGLFSLLAIQILHIRRLAILRYSDESKKFRSFQRTFDKALSDHNIRMTDLVRGTIVLPLASLVPKAYEILT